MPALSGEPHKGLAKVQLVTTATGLGRYWTLSVTDVDPITANADQSAWDFEGDSVAVTLRVEWSFNPGTVIAAATSISVQVLNPNIAGAIGSTWTFTPSGDSGSATRTLHFDTDPLDQVLGAEANRRHGMLELRLNVVGDPGGSTSDYNLDSRGTATVGPPALTTYSWARGYIRQKATISTLTVSNASLGGAEPPSWAYNDTVYARAVISSGFREPPGSIDFLIRRPQAQGGSQERFDSSLALAAGDTVADATFDDGTVATNGDGRIGGGMFIGNETKDVDVLFSDDLFDGVQRYAWATSQPAGFSVIDEKTIRYVGKMANVDPRIKFTGHHLFQVDDSAFATPPMYNHTTSPRSIQPDTSFNDTETFANESIGVNPTGWIEYGANHDWPIISNVAGLGGKSIQVGPLNTDIGVLANPAVPENSRDIEVALRFSVNDLATGRGGLFYRGAVGTSAGKLYGYHLFALGTTLHLNRFDDSVSPSATVATATIADVGVGVTYWWIRMRASEGRHLARIWSVDDAEPSTWDIDVEDVTYQTGFSGIGQQNGPAGAGRHIYDVFALNMPTRLSTQFGFMASRARNALGVGLNGITWSTKLWDDIGIFSEANPAISQSRVSATQGGEAGWDGSFVVWGDEKPGGIWHKKTVITAPSLAVGLEQDNTADLALISSDSSIDLRVAEGDPLNPGTHWRPGHQLTIGARLFRVMTPVSADEGTGECAILRFDPATGRLQYLASVSPAVWSYISNDVQPTTFAMTASPGDPDLYIKTFTAAQTADFDSRDLFIIATLERTMAPYRGFAKMEAVGGYSPHDELVELRVRTGKLSAPGRHVIVGDAVTIGAALQDQSGAIAMDADSVYYSAQRLNSSTNRLQTWNGSEWVDQTALIYISMTIGANPLEPLLALATLPSGAVDREDNIFIFAKCVRTRTGTSYPQPYEGEDTIEVVGTFSPHDSAPAAGSIPESSILFDPVSGHHHVGTDSRAIGDRS